MTPEHIEELARAIDPDAWAEDLPIPTRAHTIAFHEGRARSIAAAKQVAPIIDRLVSEAREEERDSFSVVVKLGGGAGGGGELKGFDDA